MPQTLPNPEFYLDLAERAEKLFDSPFLTQKENYGNRMHAAAWRAYAKELETNPTLVVNPIQWYQGLYHWQGIS